eukprot:365725-Chlamydomonas_euryale.AAC.27
MELPRMQRDTTALRDRQRSHAWSQRRRNRVAKATLTGKGMHCTWLSIESGQKDMPDRKDASRGHDMCSPDKLVSWRAFSPPNHHVRLAVVQFVLCDAVHGLMVRDNWGSQLADVHLVSCSWPCKRSVAHCSWPAAVAWRQPRSR